MKFLVLMLLFVVSCADSKQNKATITKISTNAISQETKQHEPVFDPSLQEIFPNTKASLLYLDPTNQQYDIKKLQFLIYMSSIQIFVHPKSIKLQSFLSKINRMAIIIK